MWLNKEKLERKKASSLLVYGNGKRLLRTTYLSSPVYILGTTTAGGSEEKKQSSIWWRHHYYYQCCFILGKSCCAFSPENEKKNKHKGRSETQLLEATAAHATASFESLPLSLLDPLFEAYSNSFNVQTNRWRSTKSLKFVLHAACTPLKSNKTAGGAEGKASICFS